MSASSEAYRQPLNSQCDSSDPQPHPSSAPLLAQSSPSAPHFPLQVNSDAPLGGNNLHPACKVSPFKPNTRRHTRLPFPKLTPFPVQDQDNDISNSLSSPTPKNKALEPSNIRGVFHVSPSSAAVANPNVPAVVEHLQSRASRRLSFDQSPSPPIRLRPSLSNNDVSAPCVPADIDVPSPPLLSSSDEQEKEYVVMQLDNARQSLVRNATKNESKLIQHSSYQSRKAPEIDTCDPPDFSQDSAFFSFSNAQRELSNDHVEVILLSQKSVESGSVEEDKTVQPQARARYYTRAFDYVIAEVLKRYSFILPSQDVDIARILRDNLSGNAQALFVRIYGRKQPQWYRVSKLEQAYAPDIDVESGVEELCRERLLISSMYALKGSPKSASLLARELLSSLDLSEMRTACASIVDGSALRRLPRNRLLPALRKLLSKSKSSRRSKKRLSQTTLSGLEPAHYLARAVLKLTGHSLRVPDFILSALKRMRFLFFLDDGHDSPNVVLADTGKVKFPEYKCQPGRTVFPSLQALKEYEAAVELEQWINESLECKDWSRAAYFGSIAELEIREFFNWCEGEKEKGLSSDANSPARLQRGPTSLEKCISSRRPAVRKRIDRKEQLEQLSHPFLRRYTAQWVFVRSCWHSVHALERLSEYESAVSRLKLLLSTNLMPRRRGKCLTRLTINLFKHLGELEEPLRIIVSALNSSETQLHLGDQIGLAQRGAAIHAKLISRGVSAERRKSSSIKRGSGTDDLTKSESGQPPIIADALKRTATQVSVRKIFGKSLNVQSKEEKDRISNIGDPWLRYIEENRNDPQREGIRTNLPIMGKSVFMSHRGTIGCVSVEEYCLEWYSAKERLIGAHDEGKSIRFLFTLLLWESGLFVEVPDVFQTPYQDRPLDLHTEAFYPSRKELIDARLEEIVHMSTDEIYEEAVGRYQRFEGIKAVGCIWTSYSSEDIASVAAGLGGPALAHCCGLLAKDYMYWGGGLPDLTLWRVEDESNSKRYRTKLVEVKSARDTLSERQRAWLMELQLCGVECEVCKVVEKVTARNASELEDATLASNDFAN